MLAKISLFKSLTTIIWSLYTTYLAQDPREHPLTPWRFPYFSGNVKIQFEPSLKGKLEFNLREWHEDDGKTNLTCPWEVSWEVWIRRVFGWFRFSVPFLSCRWPKCEECTVRSQQLGEGGGAAEEGGGARELTGARDWSVHPTIKPPPPPLTGQRVCGRLFRQRSGAAFKNTS